MKRALFTTLLCLCVAAPARASLPDIVSLGTRGPALGGTGTAFLNSFEAVYANPAGLLGAKKSLTVAAVYGAYQVYLDGGARQIDDTAGLQLGAVLPLPLGGFLRDRLALGFGFYFPFGVVNRVSEPFPEVPRVALLESRTQVISVLLGGAVRLPKGFSVGVSVLALAALVGEILIAPDSTGRITSASQEQLTVNYAPILGARWRSPAGRLLLGAVFRGESQSSYHILVKSQLGDVLPIDLPSITVAGVAQYDPMQAAAEGALALSPQLLLIANLTWKHWSAFQNPIQPATAGADPLPPPGFHDTGVPRLAVEWRPPGLSQLLGRTDLLLRLGYFFEWSPTPSDEATRSLLDASRHVFTVGAGYHLPARLPLGVSAFFQWHQLAGSDRVSGGFGMGGAAVELDL